MSIYLWLSINGQELRVLSLSRLRLISRKLKADLLK